MSTQLENGYTATEVEDEVRDRVEKLFEGQRAGLVRLEPHGWLLPKAFVKYADKLYDFEFKKDDVIVMTWPKCGTTWMQEIVWTMRNNPDFDNPKGKISVHMRCPFMDFDMIMPMSDVEEGGPLEFFAEFFRRSCPGRKMEDGVFLQLAETLEEPRTLKIHLPFSFVSPELLQKAKTVVVVRNPKDVCVSYHHHCATGPQAFRGTQDDFVDFFVKDELYYSPYWPFLKEAFEKKDHPNVLLVSFEELKADPAKEMRRLDEFLGTRLTDAQISKIVDYTKFETMRDRESAINLGGGKDAPEEGKGTQLRKVPEEEKIEKGRGFFRKGEVGDFKKKLTAEQEAKIDNWTLRNSGGLHTQLKYSI